LAGRCSPEELVPLYHTGQHHICEAYSLNLLIFNCIHIVLQMFDRDEPTREKEVYLTVRATDNGLPLLDDACTIKVIIEDINDNSPVFDKVVSDTSIAKFCLNVFDVIQLRQKLFQWEVTVLNYVLTYMGSVVGRGTMLQAVRSWV
jgi:hypothetical protein